MIGGFLSEIIIRETGDKMKTWKELFRTHILERGLNYYEMGAVDSLDLIGTLLSILISLVATMIVKYLRKVNPKAYAYMIKVDWILRKITE